MKPNLRKGIYDLSDRMTQFMISQETEGYRAELTMRDVLILDLLQQQGPMTVSQISKAVPDAVSSTVSINITKLWREKKLVSKTKKYDDQRTTIVELTDKGKKAIDLFNNHREERFNMLFQALNLSEGEEKVITDVIGRAIKFFDNNIPSKLNAVKQGS
jgi:DNA-binding MarR family transcriptional regulator